jgi:hypothetical protein
VVDADEALRRLGQPTTEQRALVLAAVHRCRQRIRRPMSEIDREELCRLWEQRATRVNLAARHALFMRAFCDRRLGWAEAGAEAGLNHVDTEALWRQLLEIAENERRDFPPAN